MNSDWEKTLYTADAEGDLIRVAGYWDGQEEARTLSSSIEGVDGAMGMI